MAEWTTAQNHDCVVSQTKANFGIGRAGDLLGVTHFMVDGKEIRNVFAQAYKIYVDYFELSNWRIIDSAKRAFVIWNLADRPLILGLDIGGNTTVRSLLHRQSRKTTKTEIDWDSPAVSRLQPSDKDRDYRVLPVVLPDFHFVTCELPMAPVRMM